MSNLGFYNKKYNDVIGTIARHSNKAGTNMSQQYGAAKQLLKKMHPDWGNVRIETTVLWDVREWWKRSARKR